MDYTDIITVEGGKGGGKPCINRMRITVYEVRSYFDSGLPLHEVLDDVPYLTRDEGLACLAASSARSHRSISTPDAPR